MRESERTPSVVREWVGKAENDLTNAVHTLKLGALGPTDTICYHAQQCVEKYLKALLVLRGMDFPRTHDLEKLASMLPAGTKVGITAGEEARLTEYATGARYPGSGEIPYAEAKYAVAMARRARKEVRRLLPREVLMRKKNTPPR
ncbi:MAG: HEPN domain-containing protein [Burkholderiales bacterium]